MTHEKLFARLETPRLNDLLEDWRWLVQGDVSLVTITAMGDMILRKGDDSYWFLDTVEGKFTKIAESQTKYHEVLSSREFRRFKLGYYCILTLVDEGIDLDNNQCYSPDIPPHLGGKLDKDNLKPTDIYVHFSMSGQIWNQTKDLKPGTKIAGVDVVGSDKSGFMAKLKQFFRR